MATFKYKIIEFFTPTPRMEQLAEISELKFITRDQNIEKTFNQLGKEGWELVSVIPIEADFAPYSGSDTNNSYCKFYKVAAYFKKQI